MSWGADRDVWRRQEWLRRMMLAGPYSRIDLFADPFFEILRENDREMMCWRLAQEIPARTGGWLPVELERYRDRADLAARWNEHLHAELEENLEEWVRDRRTAPERSLRVVFRFGRYDDEMPHLAVDVRSSGPRLHDEIRSLSQLGPLRAQARRTPGLLSSEQLLLLETLTDGETLVSEAYAGRDDITLGGLLRLLERFSGSPSITWSEEVDPDFARRYEIEPGAPIRLSSHPVSVLPTCRSDGDMLRVELGYFWPGGLERLPWQVFHVRPRAGERAGRSLVLANGEFSIVAEQPPVALMEQFEAAGGLPVAPERAKEVLAPLAAKFASVRGALAPHTRHHAARAVFAFDLDAHDWLQIRLFARPPDVEWRPGDPPPDAGSIFEYSPEGGWTSLAAGTARTASELTEVPADAAAPSAEAAAPVAMPESAAAESTAGTREIWFEAPEPRDVEASVNWLQKLSASPGGVRGPGGQMPPEGRGDEGWWMRLNARTAPALADAWEIRPGNSDWYGSDRLRAMLTGALRPTRGVRVESSGVDWFSISAEWQCGGSGAHRGGSREAPRIEHTVRQDLDRLGASRARDDVRRDRRGARRPGRRSGRGAAEDHPLAAGPGEAGDTRRAGITRAGSGGRAQRRGAAPTGRRVPRPARDSAAQARHRGASPLPAPRPRLPRLHVDARPRRRARRRHGPREDRAGARVARVAARAGQARRGPALVVCPASVVHNWEREAARFVPEMRVLLLESGGERARACIARSRATTCWSRTTRCCAATSRSGRRRSSVR